MGHLGFFQTIKNYTRTTLLIDEKITSQEASYIAQQILSRFKFPKVFANYLKFVFKQRLWVLFSKKMTFIDYQVKTFSLILIFGDLTLLKLCWAMKEAFCDVIF